MYINSLDASSVFEQISLRKLHVTIRVPHSPADTLYHPPPGTAPLPSTAPFFRSLPSQNPPYSTPGHAPPAAVGRSRARAEHSAATKGDAEHAGAAAACRRPVGGARASPLARERRAALTAGPTVTSGPPLAARGLRLAAAARCPARSHNPASLTLLFPAGSCLCVPAVFLIVRPV